MNPLVSIVPCAGYSEQEVKPALQRLLAPLGGLDFVTPGMKIAMKPNLVSAMRPESAATTHPVLLCALTGMLAEKGAEVVIGDSPDGLYNAASVNRIYNVTGMRDTEKFGARLNQDFRQTEKVFPEAKVLKSFTCTSYLDDADVIINFCKLKTHGMMGMSAAAKNMFGAVPGIIKPEYHYRFPDHADFADMIVDLNAYFKPRLCIVDAVTGMEGNGPTAGTPRNIGALIASENPHAADLLCSRLIGLTKESVPTLEAAYRRALIPATAEELTVAGDWRRFLQSDFKTVSARRSLRFGSDGKGGLNKLKAAVLARLLTARPELCKPECVGCNKCGEICPAKAIEIVGGKAAIDRKKCIFCFCCQEFCPKGAMKVKRTFAARVLSHRGRR